MEFKSSDDPAEAEDIPQTLGEGDDVPATSPEGRDGEEQRRNPERKTDGELGPEQEASQAKENLVDAPETMAQEQQEEEEGKGGTGDNTKPAEEGRSQNQNQDLASVSLEAEQGQAPRATSLNEAIHYGGKTSTSSERQTSSQHQQEKSTPGGQDSDKDKLELFTKQLKQVSQGILAARAFRSLVKGCVIAKTQMAALEEQINKAMPYEEAFMKYQRGINSMNKNKNTTKRQLRKRLYRDILEYNQQQQNNKEPASKPMHEAESILQEKTKEEWGAPAGSIEKGGGTKAKEDVYQRTLDLCKELIRGPGHQFFLEDEQGPPDLTVGYAEVLYDQGEDDDDLLSESPFNDWGDMEAEALYHVEHEYDLHFYHQFMEELIRSGIAQYAVDMDGNIYEQESYDDDYNYLDDEDEDEEDDGAEDDAYNEKSEYEESIPEEVLAVELSDDFDYPESIPEEIEAGEDTGDDAPVVLNNIAGVVGVGGAEGDGDTESIPEELVGDYQDDDDDDDDELSSDDDDY